MVGDGLDSAVHLHWHIWLYLLSGSQRIRVPLPTMNWPELWRRLTTTRYTIWLEDEVERLRAENRSMMNSLLTRAGVQPIDTPPPTPRVGRRPSRNQVQMRIEQEAYQKAIRETQEHARGAAFKPQESH